MMGLLAPLYAIAGLAIIGPIIFHLIRRQPTGQQTFSSLMFLSPSPPRLTRRSRLDNLLLLILRGLALLLIVAAFTRPFLRLESLLDRQLDGRRITLIVDTSASMRREDVWIRTQEEIQRILDGLGKGDQIALYTLDSKLHPIVPHANEAAADVRAQQQSVRNALPEISPGWLKSEIGGGLKTAADLAQASLVSGEASSATPTELILVSDLQQGSNVESLQGYPWPEAVKLDVRQIVTEKLGNAAISLMEPEASDQSTRDEPQRVRIENNANSPFTSFEVAWAGASGIVPDAVTRVQVPAGQVRIIPLPARPGGTNRIVLSGDHWDGDNEVYVADQQRHRHRLWYVGTPQPRKEDDPAYFLRQAPLSTLSAERTVEQIAGSDLNARLQIELNEIEGEPPSEKLLAIVLHLPAPELDLGQLRRFVQAGGCLIAILGKAASGSGQEPLDPAQTADLLGVGVGSVSLAQTKADDFLLLGDIDYTHPVFASFADPRFNNFSKIRFWQRQALNLAREPDHSDQPYRVIASFEDGLPFMIHRPLDRGHIWILTSGWEPTSSQFGLSSKFVPILMRILDPTGHSMESQQVYAVGAPIPIESAQDLVIRDSEGQEVAAEIQADQIVLDRPGLFALETTAGRQLISLQVAASESRMEPLDTDLFEQYGIGLGKVATEEQRQLQSRQMQVTELERKQRIWQWLLVAGLAVLALETGLAGWLARRNAFGLENTNAQLAG